MVEIRHNFEEVGRRLGNLIAQYAEAVGRDIDAEIMRQGEEVLGDIRDGWPVAAYLGGASKAAWHGERKGYAHYEMSNPLPYSIVIEHGGYLGVGKKTSAEGPQILPGGIAVGGGIFPTQRPSHPVARALSKRTVEMNEALEKVLRR